MPPLTFDSATAIQPRGDGTYAVDLRQEYAIAGSKPNGGYVLACLARAAVAAARDAGSTHEHVVASGVQFVTSPDIGAATIDTHVVRVGGTASHVTAAVAGPDGRGVHARFTLASLPARGAPYWGGPAPVDLPPLEACRPSPLMADRGTSLRFDPATSFTPTPDGLEVTGGGEFRAWLTDDHAGAVDTIGLLYAADCLPPATFGVVLTGWVPTLDMTVYVRAVPEPGPVRLRLRVQMIQDGFADEVCEGWDSAGRLVLQATQLVALRLPEGTAP